MSRMKNSKDFMETTLAAVTEEPSSEQEKYRDTVDVVRKQQNVAGNGNCRQESAIRYSDNSSADVFNENQEDELEEIIIDLDDHFCGITESDIRRVVFEYAELNNIKHNFDIENRRTSKKWYLQYIQSHPRLNDLAKETKNESSLSNGNLPYDPLIENSSLNNLVVEKFLCDYKSKNNVLKSENRETEEYRTDSAGMTILDEFLENVKMKSSNCIIRSSTLFIKNEILSDGLEISFSKMKSAANDIISTPAALVRKEHNGKDIISHATVERNDQIIESDVEAKSSDSSEIITDIISKIIDRIEEYKIESSDCETKTICADSFAKSNSETNEVGRETRIRKVTVSDNQQADEALKDVVDTAKRSSDESGSYGNCKKPLNLESISKSDEYDNVTSILGISVEGKTKDEKNNQEKIVSNICDLVKNVRPTKTGETVTKNKNENETAKYHNDLSTDGSEILNLRNERRFAMNLQPNKSDNDLNIVGDLNDESVNIFGNNENDNVERKIVQDHTESSVNCERSTNLGILNESANVELSFHRMEDSKQSGLTSSRKELACPVVKTSSHRSRKRRKSKSQTSTLASSTRKRKKSKYVYKLKSYTGSELYFTSPTSVTFMKPVITLTKLDRISDSLPFCVEKQDAKNNSLQDISGSTTKKTQGDSLSTMGGDAVIENEEKYIARNENSLLVKLEEGIGTDVSKNGNVKMDENTPTIVKKEILFENKSNSSTEGNSTSTFTMQTRKKRLKFLPDGTLITPKIKLEEQLLSPTTNSRSVKKRSFRNSTPQDVTPIAEKKHKTTLPGCSPSESHRMADTQNQESSKKEMKNNVKIKDSYQPATKQSNHGKKPQKIFDYDSYYREKSGMNYGGDQPKKILLPTPKKQTVALSRVKSISQSVKSGQLVVNPAQLLSCLLGTPISQDQIRTVRFKPPTRQQIPNNQVNITPSKLARNDNTIKPITKRQLELLQNTPLNIIPKTESQTIVKRSPTTKTEEKFEKNTS